MMSRNAEPLTRVRLWIVAIAAAMMAALAPVPEIEVDGETTIRIVVKERIAYANEPHKDDDGDGFCDDNNTGECWDSSQPGDCNDSRQDYNDDGVEDGFFSHPDNTNEAEAEGLDEATACTDGDDNDCDELRDEDDPDCDEYYRSIATPTPDTDLDLDAINDAHSCNTSGTSSNGAAWLLLILTSLGLFRHRL